MPYKKLLPRFGEDLQKLTVNSLPAGLFAESLSLTIAVVAAVAAVPATLEPANASTVTSWQFDPATNQLEITLPEGTTPTYSVLNPSQIAVNLPNTEIGVDATQLYPQGTVRSVAVSQLQPGTARILVNLAPEAAFRAGQVQFQRIGVDNRWVLRPSIEPTRSMKTPETQPQPAIQVPQNQSPTDPNSTAATIDRPELPTSLNPATTSLQQPTPNDEIRPITVPLVNLRLDERRGVQAAVVPRLNPQITDAAAPQQRTLTFGEPLPRGRSNAALQAEVGANVLLPAGTELSLLYPGTEALRLARAKPSREEVLLLQGGIFDSRGNTIVPANTPVIGRFETTNLGSRFVVEAI
ncbi:MAG: AMIN domain-containing protein, partial [Microcoleus sp. T1-bin1]|nr:AMIN domain-containing protein [Microcoleus sp. T1-bin1]